jgi:hypothetical protein
MYAAQCFGLWCVLTSSPPHGNASPADIVHEIVTGGENFFVANSFLWPMKLSTPKSGFDAKKYKPFAQGGDYGDRGDKINELVAKMN